MGFLKPVSDWVRSLWWLPGHNEIADAIEWVENILEPIFRPLTETADRVRAFLHYITIGVWEAAWRLGKILQDWWDALYNVSVKFKDAIWNFFTEAWDSFRNWATEILNKASDFLRNIFPAFREAVNNLSRMWQDFTKNPFATVGKLAEQVGGEVEKHLRPVADFLNSKILELGASLDRVRADFSNTVFNLARWADENIRNISKTLDETAKNITNALETFKKNTSDAINGLIGSATKIVDAVNDYFSNTWRKSEELVKELETIYGEGKIPVIATTPFDIPFLNTGVRVVDTRPLLDHINEPDRFFNFLFGQEIPAEELLQLRDRSGLMAGKHFRDVEVRLEGEIPASLKELEAADDRPVQRLGDLA